MPFPRDLLLSERRSWAGHRAALSSPTLEELTTQQGGTTLFFAGVGLSTPLFETFSEPQFLRL